MNHKIRGFYTFRGLFLQIDIKVCERLLSQMPENSVMRYRGKFHSLIEEFYTVLASVKCEIEEYEAALNDVETNPETNKESGSENTLPESRTDAKEVKEK